MANIVVKRPVVHRKITEVNCRLHDVHKIKVGRVAHFEKRACDGSLISEWKDWKTVAGSTSDEISRDISRQSSWTLGLGHVASQRLGLVAIGHLLDLSAPSSVN